MDGCAIGKHGLPGQQLMARAARAAFRELLERWPEPPLLQILCGSGNNGGDGLLLAALAAGRGIDTTVMLVDGDPRGDDAAWAAQQAQSAGLQLNAFSASALRPEGVVVDAILGTGIRGAPRQACADAIDAVNALALPVLSMDVPSGLDADSGTHSGAVIQAECTVSFITGKRGLYTADGPDCAGECLLDDLDVPVSAYTAAGPAVGVLALDAERAALPTLRQAMHKGALGRCLLIGGDRGTGGAVLLAAEAALRSGVGLLQVATRDQYVTPLLARTPEAMASAVRGYGDLQALLSWADALIVGPGLGQGPWGEQLLAAALASGKTMLLDADALNLIARDGDWRLPANTVITPHPGEAARLLGCTTAEVQCDRFAAIEALRRRSDGAVILKGNGSLVAGPMATALSRAGNPGMASGGMGDVLSGIVGSLLAQGLPPEAAARLGCELHAVAGDRAAAILGERALLGSDLIGQFSGLLS